MAKLTKRKLINEFKMRKEGILIGAATGLIAAYFVIKQGADLTTLVDTGKGLLDNALGRSAPLEVAQYKLYGVFAFIGATFGAIIDKIVSKR